MGSCLDILVRCSQKTNILNKYLTKSIKAAFRLHVVTVFVKASTFFIFLKLSGRIPKSQVLKKKHLTCHDTLDLLMGFQIEEDTLSYRRRCQTVYVFSLIHTFLYTVRNRSEKIYFLADYTQCLRPARGKFSVSIIKTSMAFEEI